MWDRRKLLLAAIIFTALCYRVTAKQLDMALHAVDDLYDGCRKEAMEKFIHSGLLRQELNHSKSFQEAWNRNTNCPNVIPGGIKEHTAALSAYVNGNEYFINAFNKEVETMAVNVSTYENDFHFKSLHFLLMDSMNLLKPKNCKTVYAVTDEKYEAQNGSKVRFGKFTKVSFNYNLLKALTDFDDMVVFKVFSCSFVNLTDNVCHPDTDEALLSPAEVFTVEDVKDRKDDDTEYTEIALKHSDVRSFHNCYIFSRSPAGVSTQWLVSLLVALSLFFFNY